MSAKAKELLDEYVQGLQATGSQLCSDGEVCSLADAITLSAAEDRISADELNTAAEGNLIEFLRRALAPDKAAD